MTRFRPDIQGMRALAVLLVVLDHAGVPGLRGGYVGVDVFFVISGFLITGWLLRGTERNGGKVPFGAFYAARARRILPAAALVLVATVVAAKWLLNWVRAGAVFHDSIWAAFFAANVHFARVGTDYFASSQPPSPVQHYWSLAVEEQFYLVWPALLAVTLIVVRHRARLLAVPLALLVAGSLAYSIVDTSSSQASAYFSSATRAWELGVGALLAIATSQLQRIPRAAAAIAGWLGLAAIILAATTFSSSTAFPGYAALLPVLGAAALIAAGVNELAKQISDLKAHIAKLAAHPQMNRTILAQLQAKLKALNTEKAELIALINQITATVTTINADLAAAPDTGQDPGSTGDTSSAIGDNYGLTANTSGVPTLTTGQSASQLLDQQVSAYLGGLANLTQSYASNVFGAAFGQSFGLGGFGLGGGLGGNGKNSTNIDMKVFFTGQQPPNPHLFSQALLFELNAMLA